MRKTTCDPAVEISGQALRAYVDNIQADVIYPIFERYGFKEIDYEKWYPLQPLLEVIDELASRADATSNLVAIGIKLAEYGVEPADMDTGSLPLILENWESHMYTSMRNGDVGHITTEKVNDKCYRITLETIFPDDMCYGLAYGFTRSRLPRGTEFKVWYEDFENRRDKGDSDKTVICVSWK